MNRRERKKQETRLNIMDCAVDLFQEKGFPKTSMEEIAETADVSKGTLYNYFQDKESILSAYFQSIIADYGTEIKTILKDNQGIEARLNNLLDFKSELFGNNMELTVIYLRYRMQTIFESNPFDNPQRSGLENLIVEIIAEAQENGEIRRDIPTLVIARTFLLLTVNYFISSITNKSVIMGDLRNHLMELFLNGTKL